MSHNSITVKIIFKGYLFDKYPTPSHLVNSFWVMENTKEKVPHHTVVEKQGGRDVWPGETLNHFSDIFYESFDF